ncbi:hypothetical protein CORC01_06759 [Colletotrichum orchidophilum]|uniref:Protein kinase domain-containing protein n=1 Tax=Colletotrichum orchidophilum TaxID=1209926 RepID=A0A1G4B984_9PEZI|nr:uncharacterized protein CORC01_06759 [Colletotrichum orchidophilum]OHE97896.1 hypothetical protein CORC01_06759 [Colletotrichum orchidophilum]
MSAFSIFDIAPQYEVPLPGDGLERQSSEMELLKGPDGRGPEVLSDDNGSLLIESSSTDNHVSSKSNQAHSLGTVSFPNGSVGDMSLEDRITQGVIKTEDDKDFLPADKIEALTSRSVVEKELRKHVAKERLPYLVDYVTNPDQPAKRLFLTLVVRDDIQRLEALADAPQKLHDKELPVKVAKSIDETTGAMSFTMQSIESGKMWFEFASPRKSYLDSFFHSQWQFLAPVFTTDSFRHELHPMCPLPFIKKINHHKTGFFSSVFEVVIHDAHQKVLPTVEGKKIRVASKEMRIGMDSYYEKEAEILKTIRNLESPHLIKPLAAYRRGDLRGFLFPWGEGGNLKEFWVNQEGKPHVPVKDPQLVLWVLQQLQGICGSISALHERNCRHGDLKPENILHFHENETRGILRVADVGLARFHIEATRDRKQVTNTMTGTVRYEPPEFGHTVKISRLYDVWSLGCVFLEFLIWVLYGNSKLREFNRASIEEKFWSKGDDGYHQHREVKSWIHHMSKDLKRSDITSNTALKDVLKLIDLNMLVPEVEGRTISTELHRKLVTIYEKAKARGGYLMDSTLWDRISTRAVPAEQKRSTLEVPGQRPALLARTLDTPIVIESNIDTGIISVPVPTSNAQEAQIGFPTLPGTGTPQQFILLNKWLQVCDEQHNHVMVHSTELPTRVLDVGIDTDYAIRLCDGIYFPGQRYTALSHCWGVNSQAQVRTLKKNIEEFREKIEFSTLPKSFQDAVVITRALGVRYLWIDSLCIIQDDKQDWAFEATRMEHVFSSAFCTIAATSASSSAEGFLRQKKQQAFVTLAGPDGGFTFVRKSIDDFHQDVEEAVLNQRGWVLQERALSRRTLHFTASQVYWECGRGVHCESLMRLSNRQAALLGDSNFPKSALAYFKGGRIVTFQTLYQMYSRLAFTVPSDRSIGIKGLEERLVKNFETKGGFGIFDGYLQRSLLWQKASDASLERILYPSDRRVPSWSWMAYSGPIGYLEAPFEHINWTDDIVTPFNTDSGKKTHWEVSGGSEIPLLRGFASRISLDAIELRKRVSFDETTNYRADQLRCITIGKEKPEGLTREPMHYVLVIVRLSKEKGGRYERVGVGRLLGEHILREPQLNVEVQ